MKAFFGFLALMVLSLATSAAEMVTDIIELQHGFADPLVAQVRPMLAPGASISAYDNKLLIKTTPANLDEIRRIVGQLDRAPEMLLVTVRYAEAGSLDSQRTNLNARIDDADADIHLNAKTYSTRNQDNADQQLRVLSGQSAWLDVGQDVPTVRDIGAASDANGTPRLGMAYTHVGTGFSVTPRVAGDRVMVDIAPRRSRLSAQGDGSIDSSGIDTTVNGRLGEWIPIGGAVQTASSTGSYSTRSSDYRSQQMYIKIERIP